MIRYQVGMRAVGAALIVALAIPGVASSAVEPGPPARASGADQQGPRTLEGVLVATDDFEDIDHEPESWLMDHQTVHQTALIRVRFQETGGAWSGLGSEFLVQGIAREEDYYWIPPECLRQGYIARFADQGAIDDYDRQLGIVLDEAAGTALLWGSFPAGDAFQSWYESGDGCQDPGQHADVPLGAAWSFTVGCPGDPAASNGRIAQDGRSITFECDGTDTLDHGSATSTYHGTLNGTLRFVP